VVGGTYAALAPSSAQAATAASQDDVAKGRDLFLANCATCHGLQAEGTQDAPSLIGVGAASVDFQVSTGRMPLDANGPQAAKHDPWFNQTETNQMAAYVASLAPGPAIPSPQLARAVDDPERISKGAELFRTNCAMCHNAAAAGGALTRGKFAPALAGVSGEHIYEAMVTGPQNMPVFNDANISPEGKRDIITFLKQIEANGSPGGADLGALGPVSEGLFVWIAGLGVIIAFTIWLTSRTS
jgi:ubiquinol-cytochrome c reductase cytochrome c subunit